MNLLPKEDYQLLRDFFFGKPRSRQEIVALEDRITHHPDNVGKDGFPLFHSFVDGMYRREIHVPKYALITGMIHKKPYFISVMKGHIWVVNEFGAKELKAPASFHAPAGVKNVGFTLEDTVWVDIHTVASDNIEDAEKELFTNSYDEYDQTQHIVEESSCQL